MPENLVFMQVYGLLIIEFCLRSCCQVAVDPGTSRGAGKNTEKWHAEFITLIHYFSGRSMSVEKMEKDY